MKINQTFVKHSLVTVSFLTLFSLPLTHVFAAQPAVSGTISDSGGVVNGASVTAQCDSFTTPAVLSDSSGHYSITLPTNKCATGHTVTVSAQNSGNTESGSNTGTYTGSNITVNVTITSNNNVPEFSIFTASGAVLLSGVTFMLLRKKSII